MQGRLFVALCRWDLPANLHESVHFELLFGTVVSCIMVASGILFEGRRAPDFSIRANISTATSAASTTTSNAAAKCEQQSRCCHQHRRGGGDVDLDLAT